LKTIGFTISNKAMKISENDAYLQKALEKKGYKVQPIHWQQNFPKIENLFILFRSHWNYHRHYQRFLKWLHFLKINEVPTGNSVDLISWNSSKEYLLELSQKNVPIPQSILLDEKSFSVERINTLKTEQVVIKPKVGASGDGVFKKCKQEIEPWWERLSLGEKKRGWLFQEYVEAILKGEFSIIFLDGSYSHTILKKPMKDEFRVNTQYKGELLRVEPEQWLIDKAKNILWKLKEKPLYARVDCVIQPNQEILLFEIEVNEPSLYFSLAPEKAELFAQIIHQKLQES
jgi:glutathione synthase/RimK-type ligase-like ATP-grasp enzyme